MSMTEDELRWHEMKFPLFPLDGIKRGEVDFIYPEKYTMRQIEISPGILVQSADPEHINLILMRMGGDHWGVERKPPLLVRLPIYELVRAIKEVQKYYDEEPPARAPRGLKDRGDGSGFP